jgi:hypothetical protein
MLFFSAEFVNLFLVASYAAMTVVSVFALKKFSKHNNFPAVMFWRIAKDMWKIWIKRDHGYPLIEDGRGWGAAWAATSLFATSSFCFSVLHLDYLISGDIGQVGSINSLLWFVTHFLGIVGIALVVYAAEHSHHNGHGVGYDEEDDRTD